MSNVAKKLIQTLLWLIILFGYSTVNAKPTTFNLNNNLISGNISGPYLEMDWSNQVGAVGGTTYGTGISADNLGNVYTSGYTNRGISGQTQNGKWDYFITKYGPDYNLLWTKQVGASGGSTYGTGISADNSGNIYVTGFTNVSLSGQKQSGTQDYFIAKYESGGNLLWTRQVGASGGATNGWGISADNSGNIYVTGYTNVGLSGQKQSGTQDYFIAKYESGGNLLWTRQVGTSGGITQGWGVSADESGNAYVTGYTSVGISGQKQNGDQDYFIAKYESGGNLLWTRQVGDDSGYGYTQGRGISADNAGNVYISGITTAAIFGQEPTGDTDYFIARYRTNGDLLWGKHVVGMGATAYAEGISADNLGNVYITGFTDAGLMVGFSYFVARYDKYGTLLVVTQYGTLGGHTYGSGISVGNSKNIYVTGYTDTALPGLTQNGYLDCFVLKYISVN